MQNVLVTGATRGLGLAIVMGLLNGGYRVIATGRRMTPELEVLCKQHTEQLAFRPFDLVNVENIRVFVKELTKEFGRFYGLVNNAAVGHDGVLATMHESQISQVIKVNTQAPILLSKYLSRSMLIEQKGRIINISSIIASTGFNGLSVYGATKASLEGFTKSLSRELGKGGITVNNIAPGYMETEMTAGLSSDKLESIIRRSPMRKLASTSDVAHGVTYLMSDRADMITGTTITIDGGSTA